MAGATWGSAGCSGHLDGVPLDLAARCCPADPAGRARFHLHLHARPAPPRRRRRRRPRRPAARSARSGSIGAPRHPALDVAASLEARRHRVGRLRRQHELHARPPAQGASSREHLAAGAGQPGLGPRREHRPVQPVAADAGRTCGLRHRPGGGRAPLPRVRARGTRTILPLVLDLTNPSPGPGWAGRSGARSWSGPRRRRAGARPGPPPRDLEQRPAADDRRPVRSARAWAIVEFVPKEDPMVRGCSRPGGTSSRTTRSMASGPRPQSGSRSSQEHPIEDSSRTLFLLRRR